MSKYISKYFWLFCLAAITLTMLLYGAIYWAMQRPADRNIVFLIASSAYAVAMFFSGWHFGKQNGIHSDVSDNGIFIHSASYIIWGTISLAWMTLAFDVVNIAPVLSVLFFWGIGLFFHILPFIKGNDDRMNGYVKEEIFE